MENSKITDKEFAVIREISDETNTQKDQRIIAKRTGISLGLTNIIIKRLVKKGYVKARQLNRRKIQYLLTPKGFSEKAKKSYAFTVKTINVIKSIKNKMRGLLKNEYEKGIKEIVVVGDNELSDIVGLVFQESYFRNLKITKYNTIKEIKNGNSNNHIRVLVCSGRNGYSIRKSNNTKNIINMINYLADAGLYL